MRRRLQAALALAAATLVACGDPNEPVVDEATPEPMHTLVAERCEEPEPDLLEVLVEGLDVDAELEHASIVESEEAAGLAFVAAELVGDELDDEPPIGTWAIVGEGPDADVHSVSAVARYHSSWPDGTRRDDPLTMATDGAEEAQACVEAAAG